MKPKRRHKTSVPQTDTQLSRAIPRACAAAWISATKRFAATVVDVGRAYWQAAATA
jgi:hypothetical protein